MRKDKKKIEELEKELSDAAHKISRLLSIKFDNEDTIKQLRADIAGKDEKYTELLEKYIAMMEKAAKLYNPGDEVLTIFCEIESMLLAWYAANYYDAGLATGFERIKKKHTEV